MNRVSTLWHLHTLDQELDEKIRRARQVEGQLAHDPALTTARAALEAEQRALGNLRAALRARELEAESLEAKINKTENRLYGGRVTNPKELDGMEKDYQMHKRQRSELDDQLLHLMDAIEQAEVRVGEKAAALEKIESARAIDVEHLSRERDTLTARLAELAAGREQTRAALDVDTLGLYDQLCHTKAGRAIARLRHDACSTCGVATPIGHINRIHSGDEIVFCSGCGRILAG
jgi:predicted  nucleic acid-binding Zn-ribbon protein